MPNIAGINDHNGELAESLAQGYKTLDRRSIYPEIYAMTDRAAANGQSLHILDIGAGAGNDAIEMAQAGHHVVAIEPSDLRHIAERDHPHAHIDYRDDVLPELKTIAREEQFDMVMMSAVWQYIDPSERVAALVRIGQAMRPGGTLVFTYPSPPSRPHQFEASPEMVKADMDAANQQLPRHRQLSLSGEPSILPDSRGRKSSDGRDIHFYTFVAETGHAKAPIQREGWAAGRS